MATVNDDIERETGPLDAKFAVTVDPNAIRITDKNPPSFREVRTYAMTATQKGDFAYVSAAAARVNLSNDKIFNILDNDMKVKMHGLNARIVQVDGKTNLESDFDNGFKTEERFYNFYNDDVVLTKRHTFSKDVKGDVTHDTYHYDVDGIILLQHVRKNSTQSLTENFCPFSGKLCDDAIVIFGDNFNIITTHDYDSEGRITKRAQNRFNESRFSGIDGFDTEKHFAVEFFENGKMTRAQSVEHGTITPQELELYATMGDITKVRKSLKKSFFQKLLPGIFK